MSREIVRLIGVYNAKGSVLGELAYVAGKALGKAQCALCDLTHQGLVESKAFKACRAAIPVPFALVHLDERDAAVRAASNQKEPCVLADLGDRLVVLLSTEVLESLRGETDRLANAIEDAVAREGYTFAL